MKSKAAFVVGAGIGYVLGTRAGRRQFESIKAHAAEVWNSPSVQSTVSTVQDKATEVAKEQGGALKDKVAGAVRSATSRDSAESPATPGPHAGAHEI